jgi:RHS repeat-associated protein
MRDYGERLHTLQRRLQTVSARLEHLYQQTGLPELQGSLLHGVLQRAAAYCTETTTEFEERERRLAMLVQAYTGGSGFATLGGRVLSEADRSFINEFLKKLISRTSIAETLGLDAAALFSIDPVNLANGNYIYEKTLLTIPSHLPLDFRLFYNSGSRDVKSGGWTHNFAVKARLLNGRMEVTLHDGSADNFQIVNDEYIPCAGTLAAFCHTENGYLHTSLDGSVYEFNHEGQLLAKADRIGNRLELRYENGYINTITSNQGDCLTFHYEADRLCLVTDHWGREVALHYDGGILSSVSDTQQEVTEFSYDRSGKLEKIVNANGVACLCNSFDEHGRVTSQTFPDKGEVSYKYLDRERQVVLCEQNGSEVIYEHDEKLRNTGVQYPNGREEIRWNDNNQCAAFTDKLGRQTAFIYDKNANMSGIINARQDRVDIVFSNDNQPLRLAVNGITLYESQYDEQGREIAMKDALSRQRRFEYDAIGNLIAWTAADGSVTRLSYDERGNISEIIEPTGSQRRYEYDALHRVSASMNGKGERTVYHWDARNNLTGITDAEGHTCSYRYDALGNLTESIDYCGMAKRTVYNELNKPACYIDENGRETTIKYDVMWNIKEVVNPDGGITVFSYNDCNQLASVVDPTGAVTKLTYDACGNLVERVAPDGGVYRITYDELNRPITVTNPDDTEVSAQLSALGEVEVLTYADGSQRRYDYDVMGQCVAETDPLGYTVHYEYNSLGQVSRIYDKRGDLEWRGYYPGGLLRFEESAAGSRREYAYDEAQNIISVTNEAGNRWYFDYDKLSRLTRSHNDLGLSESYSYDAMGRLLSVTDGVGACTQYAYSPTGCLTRVQDANGQETAYGYDELDRLISVGQNVPDRVHDLNAEQASITRYERDKLGRVKKMCDALGQTTEYSWDGCGRLLTKLDADGYLTKYAYNRSGLPEQVLYADNRQVQMSYDALGQLASWEDQLGITRVSYDAVGRPTAVIQPQGETHYRWSERGEQIGFIYPDGTETRYSYDQASRLQETVTAAGNVKYEYQADKLTNKYYPNMWKSSYTYDSLGRLQTLAHLSPEGKGDICRYEYDQCGHRSTIERQREGMESGIYSYDYDPAGNLTQVSLNGLAQQKYSYDNRGNRTLFAAAGNQTEYRYDILDRLIACESNAGLSSFHYDRRGNLLSVERDGVPDLSLGFGSLNRLDVLTMDKTTQHYESDGFGLRLSRSQVQGQEANVTQYVLDYTDPTTRLLRKTETIGSSTLATNLLWDGGLLAVGAPGNYLFCLNDELGTPLRTVSTDGRSTEAFSFDVFGQLTAGRQEALPIGFAGYGIEPIGGLYHSRRREYSAEWGRFLSPDPAPASLNKSINHNKYTYCVNDPVNYVDRTGCIFAWLAGGIVGAVVNVASKVVVDTVKTVVTGENSYSSWQDYTGAAVGGFVQGTVLVTTGNPKLAAVAGGATEAFVAGGLGMLTGAKDAPGSLGELAGRTVVGGATSLLFESILPGVEVKGASGVWSRTIKMTSGGLWRNLSWKTVGTGIVAEFPGALLGGFVEDVFSGLFKPTDVYARCPSSPLAFFGRLQAANCPLDSPAG